MKFRIHVILGILAVAALAMVVATSIGSSDEQPADQTAGITHFRDTDVRIEITEDARVSRNQDPVWVQLDFGEIPAEVTHLSVLTDEDCTPDAEGVSHCLNRVEFLHQGQTVQAGLRHHHKMSEEPCLAPGQTLEIVK